MYIWTETYTALWSNYDVYFFTTWEGDNFYVCVLCLCGMLGINYAYIWGEWGNFGEEYVYTEEGRKSWNPWVFYS